MNGHAILENGTAGHGRYFELQSCPNPNRLLGVKLA